MTEGGLIRQARKKAHITQEELGSKLGVSGSMIAQYETGKRKPKIDTLKRIAAALGVELWELTEEKRPADVIRIHVSPDNLEDSEFMTLMEKDTAGTLTKEEEERFLELLKKRVYSTKEMKEKIEKLEKTLAEISEILSSINFSTAFQGIVKSIESLNIAEYRCQDTTPPSPEGKDTTAAEPPGDGTQKPE